MELYLGIDIGGTNIAVGIVNELGELLYKDSVKTLAPRPAEGICRDTADLCRKVLADFGVGIDQISAVGAGCPGVIWKGVVHRATNLKFRDAPVADLIGRELGRPVVLVNDADAAAYGEFAVGWDRKPDPFVMITIGTGIGGGIILDGKIRAGHNGAGGEIGHTVINSTGRKCPCGRVGCLERYCSASALERDIKKVMKSHPESVLWKYAPDRSTAHVETLFQAAAEQDETAVKLLDRYIGNLAVGIKNITALLQPELLCVGGGVSNAGDALISPLSRRVDGMSRREGERHRTNIRAAKLRSDAGIIGAALWSRHSGGII